MINGSKHNSKNLGGPSKNLKRKSKNSSRIEEIQGQIKGTESEQLRKEQKDDVTQATKKEEQLRKDHELFLQTRLELLRSRVPTGMYLDNN